MLCKAIIAVLFFICTGCLIKFDDIAANIFIIDILKGNTEITQMFATATLSKINMTLTLFDVDLDPLYIVSLLRVRDGGGHSMSNQPILGKVPTEVTISDFHEIWSML